MSIQTFGDLLGFNPHGHVLLTDGCFPEHSLFKIAPAVKLKQMVHYYGLYSNLSRGLRQKVNHDALIPLLSMEILNEPPHLLVESSVEFNLLHYEGTPQFL